MSLVWRHDWNGIFSEPDSYQPHLAKWNYVQLGSKIDSIKTYRFNWNQNQNLSEVAETKSAILIFERKFEKACIEVKSFCSNFDWIRNPFDSVSVISLAPPVELNQIPFGRFRLFRIRLEHFWKVASLTTFGFHFSLFFSPATSDGSWENFSCFPV